MTDETLAAAGAGDALATADNATTTASVDLTKPDGPEPSETQATSEASDTEDTGEPKRKSVPGSQKWKARALALEAELEQARQQRGVEPTIPGLGEAPKEADFPGDYLAFERASTAYEAAKRILVAQAEASRPAREAERASLMAEQQQTYEASVSKARSVIPDFDKVLAESAKSQIAPTPELAREIMSSEKAPLLQYHLSKPENWQLLREINSLTGRELAREIGRLEGRLHMPRARTQTNAPPPVQPVGSGASSTRPPAEMSYREFVKFRESGGKVSL